MEKHRTAVSVLLIAIGVGLLVYGLSSRADVASPGEQGQVSPASELPATQEVAKNEVAQETPGQVKKAGEDAKKAPAACPT